MPEFPTYGQCALRGSRDLDIDPPRWPDGGDPQLDVGLSQDLLPQLSTITESHDPPSTP